ncbi:MAG: D-Ala-D-Ala carboxypeptidase family metallohydrolase [Pseudomonadota bacterium]
MLFQTQRAAARSLAGSWRWPHFRVAELACQCGGRFCDGEYWHDAHVLDGLEAVRASAGRALIVTSGHRCAQWNAAVGGAPFSRHKTLAVDIALSGHDRQALRMAAEAAGFTGLGLARTFLHLDRRRRPATWFYGRSKEAWTR